MMKKKMTLQWHITNRCNCQCAHCYQENDEQIYDAAQQSAVDIIDQFKDLLLYLGMNKGPVRGQVNITGGEPFLYKNFFGFLELLAANKAYFDFAILTNGTMISAETARHLKQLGPSFVQISIEGPERIHDKIRGQGNYHKTIVGLRNLREARVRTYISFTANHDNFREFGHVAELGSKFKVAKVWADRHIPMGRGSNRKESMLSPEETCEFFSIIEKTRQENSRRWFSSTKIGLERGLQFLCGGGRPYRCAAGESLITVMPNGDVYPCRRMPIMIGNVADSPLKDMYASNLILRKLRDLTVSVGCEGCLYAKDCGGGLRCLSYAVFGDFQQADPGCWYSLNH